MSGVGGPEAPGVARFLLGVVVMLAGVVRGPQSLSLYPSLPPACPPSSPFSRSRASPFLDSPDPGNSMLRGLSARLPSSPLLGRVIGWRWARRAAKAG